MKEKNGEHPLGDAGQLILFYNYIAGYEEKLLEIKLGKAYITYKENTGKWMPRLGKRR